MFCSKCGEVWPDLSKPCPKCKRIWVEKNMSKVSIKGMDLVDVC